MYTVIVSLLIVIGLFFCSISVFFFCRTNHCACTRAGTCNNPVNCYWLGAIISALISLAFCCLALNTQLGTLLWLVLMGSCFLGAFISQKRNKKSSLKKTTTINALLISEIN